jgi:hypothetical protein
MTTYFKIPGFAAERVQVTCPPPAQGQTSNAQGDYDPLSVAHAVHASGTAWLVCTAIVVIACYNWTRLTMSPRFVKRWWLFVGVAAVAGGAVVAAVLRLWPTKADANACQSDPRAFPAPLPADFVWAQGVAGFLYGILLFGLLSILFTWAFGRFAYVGNGFFHNRGCPIPRALP